MEHIVQGLSVSQSVQGTHVSSQSLRYNVITYNYQDNDIHPEYAYIIVCLAGAVVNVADSRSL